MSVEFSHEFWWQQQLILEEKYFMLESFKNNLFNRSYTTVISSNYISDNEVHRLDPKGGSCTQQKRCCHTYYGCCKTKKQIQSLTSDKKDMEAETSSTYYNYISLLQLCIANISENCIIQLIAYFLSWRLLWKCNQCHN